MKRSMHPSSCDQKNPFACAPGARKPISCFLADTGGDAIVEATILFPIIFMIFAGLVLLSMYLPVRSSLQRATQQAVTAIATEKSDTWLTYDANALQFRKESSQQNVYAALFNSFFTNGDREKMRQTVINMENKSIVKTPGTITIECSAVNFLIYKELTVTATRTMPMPVDLSFVGFPKHLTITASSTALVPDADGFIRDVDMINDILPYLKWNVGKVGDLINIAYSLFG